MSKSLPTRFASQQFLCATLALKQEGNSTVPLEFSLIPADTRLESNGDGAPLDISETVSRTFFCTLTVTEQIEQESLDVSIWGPPNRQAVATPPLFHLPHHFYHP